MSSSHPSQCSDMCSKDKKNHKDLETLNGRLGGPWISHSDKKNKKFNFDASQYIYLESSYFCSSDRLCSTIIWLLLSVFLLIILSALTEYHSCFFLALQWFQNNIGSMALESLYLIANQRSNRFKTQPMTVSLSLSSGLNNNIPRITEIAISVICSGTGGAKIFKILTVAPEILAN